MCMGRLIDEDVLMRAVMAQSVVDKSVAKRLILQAPTAFKWHDPDEELPKHSGVYICLVPNNNPYSPNWRIELYRWNKGHFWWSDSEWGEGIVTDCHWWAEIPKLPKMEEME